MNLRKKYQRRINRIVRDMNKNIQNDWIWDGRFYIHQEEAEFHSYDDHSGGEVVVLLSCLDRKTNKIEYKVFSNYDIGYNLYHWVNDCIVEKFDVWNEIPNPREYAMMEGRYYYEINLY